MAFRQLDQIAPARTQGRIIRVSIAGRGHWAAVEDATRLRDALGVALPVGVPVVFLEPTQTSLRDLIARYARTHAPFNTGEAADRFGLGADVADEVLQQLSEQGKLLKGNFGVMRRLEMQTPGVGTHPLARHEWIDDNVFKRLRLRSLQAAREATRAVPQQAYVRLLLERQGLVPEVLGNADVPARHAVDGTMEGAGEVARVIEQLAGVPLPASLWESQVLPARVRDYAPGLA
ncbi:hypothetical protein [Pseudomonas cyclaminis]|uniref:Lhr family ATP-dependent helicase n=1 Tax=Pseudomonas cyclaminis TaxID=2781239 RepID=UPI00381F606B